MASIDKIFGTEKQLYEFRTWLLENKPEYLCYVTNPASWFFTKPLNADALITIAIFPDEASIWLYNNCPIKHITNRIREQYEE